MAAKIMLSSMQANIQKISENCLTNSLSAIEAAACCNRNEKKRAQRMTGGLEPNERQWRRRRQTLADDQQHRCHDRGLGSGVFHKKTGPLWGPVATPPEGGGDA